jgi:hypothetical protein
MSRLGIILLGVALLGAVVAGGAGWFIIQARAADAANLASVKQQADSATKQASASKAQLKEVQEDEAKDKSDLADAQKKVDDLNNQLTTATKTATDAQSALSSATDKATAAQKQLDDINAAMGGQSPEQFKASVDKAQKDLQAAQDEQKILQDQLASSNDQIEQLKKDINAAKTGAIPPGVSGKVTFVDRTWNFVVLNVGLSNGVVPNGELIVYRGRNFLGKVRVTKADPNDAVAEILPDIKGDIQVGDSVLN